MRSRWSRAALVAMAGTMGVGCNWILGIHELGDNRTDASDTDGAADASDELTVSFWRPDATTDGGDARADAGDAAIDGTADAHAHDGAAEGGSAEAGALDGGDASVDAAPPGCPSGTLECDGGCVASSNSNCGGCGILCSAGTVCSASDGGTYSCVSTCSGGTPDYCGGQCVNETNSATPNATNCGGCGTSFACSGGMTCQSRRCACPSSQSTCGGATCIDLMGSDANNCGACGHGCMGGTCSAGKCQPNLFAIVDGQAESVWADRTAAYIAIQGESTTSLISIDKQSGAQLGDVGADLNGFALSGPAYGTAYTTVAGFPGPGSYWSIYQWSVPTLSSGNPAVPYTEHSANASTAAPVSIAVSGNTLLWLDGHANLYQGDAAGDATRPISLVESSTAGAVVIGDDAGFVWSEATGGFLAAARSALGAPVRPRAPSSSVPKSVACIALDASNIYWFDQTAGAIFRTARDGSTNYVTMAAPASATQIAVDATNLYWVDSFLGTVYSLPKTASSPASPTVVASQFLSGGSNPQVVAPFGVAVDDTAIYVTADYNSQVSYLYRIAK